MSDLELSQRIREQSIARRNSKPKYRGVTYIQKNNYGTTIQENGSQRYETCS